MAKKKEIEYEFWGPYLGPLAIIFLLPIVIYFLASLAREPDICWSQYM